MSSTKKSRKEGGASVATLNRDLACLSVLFREAVEWKAMYENPMKAIKRFKEEDQLKNFKPLTDRQEDALIEACGWTQNQQTKEWFEDPHIAHLKPIVTIAIDTGMRLSEILNLKWSQIDFEEALITLTRTKNHKPRQIPISARLMMVLKDWRSRTEGNDWLFCSKIDGEALGTVKKSFTSARRQARVRIHFHGLRHGFATKLLAAGVDIKTVQELMGQAIPA